MISSCVEHFCNLKFLKNFSKKTSLSYWANKGQNSLAALQNPLGACYQTRFFLHARGGGWGGLRYTRTSCFLTFFTCNFPIFSGSSSVLKLPTSCFLTQFCINCNIYFSNFNNVYFSSKTTLLHWYCVYLMSQPVGDHSAPIIVIAHNIMRDFFIHYIIN